MMLIRFTKAAAILVNIASVLCLQPAAQATQAAAKVFALPTVGEIEIKGIIKLEILSGKSNSIEFKGNPDLIKKIDFSLSDTPYNKVNILSLETSDDANLLNKTVSDLPKVTIRLQNASNIVNIFEKSHNGTIAPTKVYIDTIKTKFFNYLGTGNSEISILKLHAKLSKLSTNAKQDKSDVSADIKIKNVVSSSMDLNIKGGSNIFLAGKVDKMHILTTTAADHSAPNIFADTLKVENCNVRLDSYTALKIHVTDSFMGDIGKEAEVYYYGNPFITVSKANSATLKKIDSMNSDQQGQLEKTLYAPDFSM